ncbi:protein-L-isoaspartate(D-aspartate) O-methyltransferase [Pelistega sp. NLN82]|uniref:Protein-L-isoaspartate O-methyltransferase n=1 Tax=Pelistega ratti TaxID=2652177 RepID=A0A6L9Y7G8_9BURK|nr:protein-L-isoaspartate(D-aspartate) O-methyltransferase [Pelistega ratti]NEN76273.1 protein-L-isoaspartate(D-aspartate) O-methyltransferase [Pelistega ratti]
MHKKAKITLSNSNARLIQGNNTVRFAKPTLSFRGVSLSQNSNTKVRKGNQQEGSPIGRALREQVQSALLQNKGLNSDQLRINMVHRLKVVNGITDDRVLKALMQIKRHHFMDQGTAVRAYEDEALPIGFGQTISMPSVVARMISLLIEQRTAKKVLEIGTGCGYQAAVLACIFQEVYSIERIEGLYHLAKQNIAKMIGLPPIHSILGDGMQGLPTHAPFDAIIIAAAGLKIPQALLSQLAIGGRLIAPEGTSQQRLVLIERKGQQDWVRTELEETRFVPLLAGVQR